MSRRNCSTIFQHLRRRPDFIPQRSTIRTSRSKLFFFGFQNKTSQFGDLFAAEGMNGEHRALQLKGGKMTESDRRDCAVRRVTARSKGSGWTGGCHPRSKIRPYFNGDGSRGGDDRPLFTLGANAPRPFRKMGSRLAPALPSRASRRMSGFRRQSHARRALPAFGRANRYDSAILGQWLSVYCRGLPGRRAVRDHEGREIRCASSTISATARGCSAKYKIRRPLRLRRWRSRRRRHPAAEETGNQTCADGSVILATDACPAPPPPPPPPAPEPERG